MSALHHCTRALLAKHSTHPSPRRISIAAHSALILALALSSPSQDAQAQAQEISIPADEARNTTVNVATDNTTLTLDGEITTDGEAAIAVTGANLSLTHRGAITTENADATGIVLNGANPVVLMPRGSIDIMGASVGIFADSDATNTRITLGDADADPIGTAADGTANACNPMIHACISTRGAQGHGVSLGTFGAADPDNNPETEDNVYIIETHVNSRISTQGAGAHGIVLRDTPNSTAQAQLSLRGEIVVTGQDAIGVNIADSTGAATAGFFVPGRISATGNAGIAIQDAAARTRLFLSSGARITGDINLGGGNDAITLAAGARVAGDIDLGAGNDTLDIRTTLTGNVDGGAGDDTFTFRPGGEITGTLAGGAGDDTLNFLLLSDAQRRSVMITDAMTGTGEASFLNTDAAGVAGFTGIETLTGEVEEFSGVADSHARWTLAPMDIRYQALTAAASDPGAMDVGAAISLPATTNLLAGANLSDTFIISTAFQGSLSGGTGNDVFRFQPNGAIASNLTGGAGVDHLDYSARPDFIGIILTASDADGFSGTATAITGVFSGIDQLTAGTGISQLFGLDSDATWTLGVDAQGNERNTYALIRAVPAGGPAVTDTLIFSGFDRFGGQTGADTFNIDADHQRAIILDGGGGDDVFNIRTTVRSQFNIALVGSSGDDRFIFANDGAVLSGNTSTGDISGASGNDSLQGDNDGNAFTLTGSNQGTLAEKIAGQFFNIENLIGGTGADTFTFDDAGNLTGNLDGGAGTDTLDYSARTDDIIITLTGSDATGFSSGAVVGSRFVLVPTPAVVETPITGGFSGIDQLTANANGLNQLRGDDAAATWTVDTAGTTYALMRSVAGGPMATDTLSFSGFDDLIGGSMADTFTINVENLSLLVSGGAGNDRFNINAGIRSISGGAGNDTFTFGAAGRIGIPSITPDTNPLRGEAGTDTLIGNNNGNSFTLTGSNSGQLADSAGMPLIGGVGFTNIENLTGGSMADTFTFQAGSSLSGSISGGAGSDHLDYSARTDSLSATLTASDATGFAGGAVMAAVADGQTPITGGFSGINQLTGGTGTDSLTGNDAAATWTVDTAGNTYVLMRSVVGGQPVTDSLTFSSFDNLTGGSLADTFNINAAHSGNLDGGAGNDSFTIAATLSGNLLGGAGFDRFDFDDTGSISGNLMGGENGDSLFGDGNGNAFTLTGMNSGTLADKITAGFTGIENLYGGDGADSFTFDVNGSIDGELDGVAGIDTLIGDNDGNRFTLTGNGEGELDGKIDDIFLGIENLSGGTGADSFNINADHSGNLDGRGGTDSFDIRATLTGALTGGAGADRFTLHADGRIAGGSLAGGTGTDTLIGNNNGNAFSLTGNNNGQLADSAGTALIANGFTGIENLTGGTGNDRFAFAAAGSLSGNLVGGAGTDHLDYSARTDSLSATLTASDADGFSGGAVMATVAAGQTPITGGFSGINQLTGGTATDSLTGDDADATWTLGADAQGNERNSYALMRSVVGGQPVTDTLTFSGFDNLTGGSLADTFNIDAAHSGDLDGGAGADTFNIANTLMGNIDGGAGDDTFTFSGAGAITGTLAGGTGDDTLNFMALSDVERLSVMMTDAATGTGVASFINGGGAAGFTGIETLEGFLMRFTGDANRHARWTLASAGNSYQALTAPASDPNAETVGAVINLTASVNTLVGGDLSDTFDIATAFDGTLQGGAGDNTFTFADGGSIAGAASGGAGTDHLDYGARTAPITITLTASDAMGFAGGPVVATRTQTRLTGGFTGIDRLTGGTGTDSLTGHNAAATWTLGTAGNSYAVGNQSLVFSNFENLTGGNMADSFTLSIDHTGNLDAGAGDDVFNLADGGEVGEIAGGAGTDHLDYSRRTDAATLNVTLARRDAGGFSGTAPATDGFSGINQLTGRQGDSRLIGMDVSAIWTLDTAGNSYTGTGGQTQDPLRFSGFATLIGRSNADSFTINTNHSGDIIGGDGADAFIFGNDGSLSGNLTGGDGDDRLQGDDDDNRFTLSARNEGTLDDKIGGRFFGIENLTGGSGADTFTFEDSGEISGTLEGGMGTDHLDHSSRTDAIRVTLTASDAMGFDGRATATDGFSGIDRLSGGTGIDRLTGHNAAAAWTLGAAGNSYAVGNQSLVFSNFENLIGGSMADTFTLSADHTGNIDTGAGNDSITLAGSARITGDINLGEGDDSLSFASADVRFMGLADGGAGTDTLNGLDLFTTAMPTTLFRYTNFEIVNGEAELLANLPVIRMQETETTAAMRTLISYVDRPPEGRMPEPDSMGGGQPPAPVPAMPDMGTDTDSTDRMGAGIDTDMGGGDMVGMGTGPDSTDTDMGTDGDGTDMGGMDGGGMAGTDTDSTDMGMAGTDTGTDTDTPTPPTAPVTPTRETEMAERIAALSRDYGGEVTPLNAAGDGPQDVNAYLFVDPTGPAAQAASVEALSTRINHILNQRLSGGLRGGRHAARPVSSGMNQSNNQITQRLSGGLAGGRHALRPLPLAAGATGGGDGPLLWGEIFAAERRRGQDGLTLSHVHDYQGLVFGAEQVDPSGQQRLGVLFGYADADIRTDLRSLELDTGSLFGGVYGRFSRQALAINLGLNLGYESHDNRRYIPQLQQVAEADYHSIFVNPWLSLSRAWPLREGLELRPALMLNYSVARYDGYEERGGQGFALAVAGRTAHNLSTRLQLAGVRTEPDTGHELGLRLGVEGRLAGGGHFEGRLGGSSFDYSDAEDRSAQAVFIGLDGRHALSEALTLQLDVEYSHHIGGVSERSLGGFVRLEYAY